MLSNCSNGPSIKVVQIEIKHRVLSLYSVRKGLLDSRLFFPPFPFVTWTTKAFFPSSLVFFSELAVFFKNE